MVYSTVSPGENKPLSSQSSTSATYFQAHTVSLQTGGGMRVAVGVRVGVAVGVWVGVNVGVAVGVRVRVEVRVRVAVRVAVGVRVFVLV